MRHEQFDLRLQVEAEPRFQIGLASSLRLSEAVDDRDQSLLVDDPANHDAIEPDAASVVGLVGGATMPILVELRHPEGEGRSIRRLGGVVPLVVAMRRPDPLIASLENAAGRAFRNDEVLVTVYAVRNDPANSRVALELGLRPRHGAADNINTLTEPPDDLDPHRLDRCFEAVDKAGRTLSSYVQTPRLVRGEVRLRLLLVSGEGVGNPAFLKIYGITQAKVKVPFHFINIPIP